MTRTPNLVRAQSLTYLTEASMAFPTSSFLRRALTADAAISGATGAVMIVAADVLARLLDVPATLLRYAGISLIPFVAYVLYLSRRPALTSGSVWLVITLNIAWVIASGVLLLSGEIHPNALGYAFVIAQAIAVAAFAEMQYVGLRGKPA
jgi:hypothetical protein